MRIAGLLGAILLLLATFAHAQVTTAVADDSHVDESGNKFLQREATRDKNGAVIR